MTGGKRREFRKTWGCELLADGEARFKIWAPAAEAITLRLNDRDHAMHDAGGGWFEATAAASDHDRYSFVLADGLAVPDPASRAQANDVHGPSLVIDPRAYVWGDSDWKGRRLEELVIYELHAGTFTPGGTFRSAIERLPHLAETGITAVEIMPVSQFAGSRGWGYDGVLPYAPHNAYGTPDDMKAFVDAAHQNGLAVLLDVVYNHFGPDGNYLGLYAPDFFDESRHTPWGAAIAYEKEPVRRFFIDNALYWLDEYHLDGLRLDAIDNIRDPNSSPEILVELAQAVRQRFSEREIHLTSEDNRNITTLHERSADGSVPLYSAEWNDDFHNAAHVIATGETDGYYSDFADHPLTMLGRSLAEGFVFQGQLHHGKRRGAPSAHMPPTAFVDFLQNHDQTGNRAFGDRLATLTDPSRAKALTAILLLSPHIPMLFMGEEFGETRPFCFFTDFHGDLADAVREGRRREFAHFGAFQGHPDDLAKIPDPNAKGTFDDCCLDWDRLKTPDGRTWISHTRHLLALRHRHVVPMLEQCDGNAGTVIAAEDGILAVDWALSGGKLQMRANLGHQEAVMPAASGTPIFELNETGADRLDVNGVRVTVEKEVSR